MACSESMVADCGVMGAGEVQKSLLALQSRAYLRDCQRPQSKSHGITDTDKYDF